MIVGQNRRFADGVTSQMLRHQLFRLAILVAFGCGTASLPALADSSSCTQAGSDDIPAAPPEQVGMQSGRLAEAIKSLRNKNRDIHGLVVLRRCGVVVELYAENVTRDHNHALYSVTKSVVVTLLGALLRSGRLPSFDLPVAKIVTTTTELDADKLDGAKRNPGRWNHCAVGPGLR